MKKLYKLVQRQYLRLLTLILLYELQCLWEETEFIAGKFMIVIIFIIMKRNGWIYY